MPAGYSARCKVCNSGHRTEVEKWVKEEGVSYREAERRLKELGVKVSHVAIRRHCEEHFDVKAEAREQYQKSQQQMQEIVQKQLSDIEMLNQVAAAEFKLHQATGKWLADLVQEQCKLPMSLVVLHEKTASEMRQAIKQKQELLGDDPESKKADAVQSLVDLMVLASDDSDD